MTMVIFHSYVSHYQRVNKIALDSPVKTHPSFALRSRRSHHNGSPLGPTNKARPAIFVTRRVVVWACFRALSPAAMLKR